MEVKTEYEKRFESRYTYDYAMIYYKRHKQGLLKKFSNVLEQRMAYKGLMMANKSAHMVDLPCGAGRFWKALIKAGASTITAVDRSTGMIQVCKEMTDPRILKHVSLLQGDAMQIPLPDKSADGLICMRLMHHIHDAANRIKMYKEFQRVTRNTVCISFRVDGNIKSYAHRNIPNKNRYLNIEKLEAELKAAGFRIIGKVDMLPYYLPWRMYVLSV